MADLMPGIPSVPGDESTWQAFVDQFETLKRGDMPLSLTNWDDTDTRPALAAGAAIEIAGATYRFPSEVAIDNATGLVAGKVYVVIQTSDPNPESATPYFTNVEPVWYADLHGWYDAAGFSRYTGHVMTWDGASGYSFKHIFQMDRLGDTTVGGTLGVTGNTTVGGTLGVVGNVNIGGALDVVGAINALTLKVGNTTFNTQYITTIANSAGRIDVPHGVFNAITTVLGFIVLYKNTVGDWRYYHMEEGNVGINATNIYSATDYTIAADKQIKIIIFHMES